MNSRLRTLIQVMSREARREEGVWSATSRRRRRKRMNVTMSMDRNNSRLIISRGMLKASVSYHGTFSKDIIGVRSVKR
jgi:hypothetical protein